MRSKRHEHCAYAVAGHGHIYKFQVPSVVVILGSDCDTCAKIKEKICAFQNERLDVGAFDSFLLSKSF